MVIFVAELVVDHHQTLGVAGQRQLPGHADSAMHLDAFLGHRRAKAGDAVLGGRQRRVTRQSVVRFSQPRPLGRSLPLLLVNLGNASTIFGGRLSPAKQTWFAGQWLLD